jgi:HEAT repeat protein
MATTLTCPRCTHKNVVDDAKAKKEIHCRICHHLLTPASGSSKAVASEPKSKTSGLVKEGPPPKSSPKAADSDRERVAKDRPTPPPPKSAARNERENDPEESDRRRAEARPKKKKSGGSVLYWLLGGAGVLLVLGCCVTAPVLYFVFGWTFGGGPRAEPWRPIDPRIPGDAKRVLTMLQQAQDREEAIEWLKVADPNNPLRSDLAKQLEVMVDEQKRVPWSNDKFFVAYFRWATKDNFPSLIQMVQDATFTVDTNHRRQKSIESFGKLKDERAAEAIVMHLGNVFDGGHAQRAIEEMGPLAQPALLKHMNDPHDNGSRRNAVRKLLLAQQVSGDMLLTQTVADLGSADEKVRIAAMEWLQKTPVNPKRQLEVSRALDKLINAQTLDGNMIKVLEIWGTAENGLTVANAIDNGNVFKAADLCKLLGKLKDPRTIPALASRMGEFGFIGNAAQDSLKQFGSVAEPEVVKRLNDGEGRMRSAAVKVLAQIGTPQVSVPALQRAMQIYAKEAFFPMECRNAIQSIQARAGT